MSDRLDGRERAVPPGGYVVPTSAVGVTGEAVDVVVEPRWAANFAAGLGAELPAYFDDRDPAALRSPPTLACALTAAASRSLGAAILTATDLPAAAFDGQLHYSEVLEFEQPLLPGMRLSVIGSLAAVRPHRLGTELVVRYEALCDGRPVFREFLGSLARGVRADQDCAVCATPVPDVPTELSLAPGASPEFRAVRTIERRDPYLYDASSNISFPLHTSRRFAESVGVEDIVLHGTAVLGLAVEACIAGVLGDPSMVRTVACRFGGLVLPGTVLTIDVYRSGLDLLVDVRNGAGAKVLRGCRITVAPSAR